MAILTSITGLQNLPNLAELRADWHSLSTIDLSGLTNLTYVDVSDQEQIPVDNGNKILTSIDVTGSTAITELRADGLDFSENGLASIIGLIGLVNLGRIDIDGCELSGSIDLGQFENLWNIDINNNPGVTQLGIASNQPITSLNALDCGLTQANIDAVLATLVQSQAQHETINGWVDLTGDTMSYPSQAGLQSKQALVAAGWQVDTNPAPPGRVGIAASTDFDIVGDFTIEMFVNLSNANGNPRPYSFGAYPSAANAISFEGSTTYFWGNSSVILSGSFTPTLGQWYHVCIQRSGNTIKMFVDGISIASATNSANIPSQGLPLTIGYGNEPNSGWNGLMSNFRWTSSAVYNHAGFTPPTSALTDLANTKLLIFQGNDLAAQLTDNSGNNHNATNAGANFSTNDPFNTAAGSLQMGNV